MTKLYRIEKWSHRGVTTEERPTKLEANTLAASYRADPGVSQTIVIRPNGLVRICRNTQAKPQRA